MTTKSIRAACGIRVVASTLGTRDAIAAARAELAGGIFQHILVFFSMEHDPACSGRCAEAQFSRHACLRLQYAGEMGPLGMMQGGIVMIAFPESGFRVLSEIIPEIDKAGVERASEIARRLRIQMIGGASRSSQETSSRLSSPTAYRIPKRR